MEAEEAVEVELAEEKEGAGTSGETSDATEGGFEGAKATGGVGRDLDTRRTGCPTDRRTVEGRLTGVMRPLSTASSGRADPRMLVEVKSKTLEEGELGAVSRRVAKTCLGEPCKLGEAYGRYVLGAGEIERAIVFGRWEGTGAREEGSSAVGVV